MAGRDEERRPPARPRGKALGRPHDGRQREIGVDGVLVPGRGHVRRASGYLGHEVEDLLGRVAGHSRHAEGHALVAANELADLGEVVRPAVRLVWTDHGTGDELGARGAHQRRSHCGILRPAWWLPPGRFCPASRGPRYAQRPVDTGLTERAPLDTSSATSWAVRA